MNKKASVCAEGHQDGALIPRQGKIGIIFLIGKGAWKKKECDIPQAFSS